MFNKQLFALAAVCLPHLISTEQNILVRSQYPQAYAWYCDLAKKYPEANLENIPFYVSDHHHASRDAIFWPESNLQIINRFYLSAEISPKIQQLLQEDEYLLLHEARHVLKKHLLKAAAALTAATVAGSAIISSLAEKACSETISATTAITSAASTLTALTAGIISYARSQETDADNFANQQAGKKALEAGINWHKTNQEDLNLDPAASAIQNNISTFLGDSFHPAPKTRQEESQAALSTRFSS